MIFQHTLPSVLSGNKCVTRRRCYPGDSVKMHRGRMAVVKHNGFPRWIFGQDYAVHARRGVKAEPGIRVRILNLSTDPNPLLISEDEAKLEGFESAAAFVAAWRKLHRNYAGDSCWRIRFELVRKEVAA